MKKNFTHVTPMYPLTGSKLLWGLKLQQKVNLGASKELFF